MKIALLLTGQLRTFELCKHNIKNLIIDRYDTDVFLSIDRSNKHQWDYLNSTETTEDSLIKSAIDFFKPRDYTICETYDEIYKNDIKKLNKDDIVKITPYEKFRPIFEQYYIVKEGYRILIDYSNKTSTSYDIILRCRFDTIIWPRSLSIPDDILYKTHPGDQTKYIKYNRESMELVDQISKQISINLDRPNLNEIYVIGWNFNGKESWVNEQFWSHSSSLNTIIYKYYDELFTIINDMLVDGTRLTNIPFVEMWFFRFLQKYDIKLLKSSVIVPFCRGNHN